MGLLVRPQNLKDFYAHAMLLATRLHSLNDPSHLSDSHSVLILIACLNNIPQEHRVAVSYGGLGFPGRS